MKFDSGVSLSKSLVGGWAWCSFVIYFATLASASQTLPTQATKDHSKLIPSHLKRILSHFIPFFRLTLHLSSSSSLCPTTQLLGVRWIWAPVVAWFL